MVKCFPLVSAAELLRAWRQGPAAIVVPPLDALPSGRRGWAFVRSQGSGSLALIDKEAKAVETRDSFRRRLCRVKERGLFRVVLEKSVPLPLEGGGAGGGGTPPCPAAGVQGFVGDGELAQVVASHPRLHFHLVERLEGVDTPGCPAACRRISRCPSRCAVTTSGSWAGRLHPACNPGPCCPPCVNLQKVCCRFCSDIVSVLGKEEGRFEETEGSLFLSRKPRWNSTAACV